MHYGGNSASVSAHVDILTLYLASVGEVNIKEITELKTGPCMYNLYPGYPVYAQMYTIYKSIRISYTWVNGLCLPDVLRNIIWI